jgi:hypothetical protein
VIDNWLKIPYKAYARGLEGSDCWGLVCIVRKAIRGDDLPPFVEIQDKRALTHAAHEMIGRGFKQVDTPKPGALVAVWRGKLCLHVGIVITIDDRLAIIDSNEKRNVRWQWLPDFERQNIKVTYHDNDQSIPVRS